MSTTDTLSEKKLHVQTRRVAGHEVKPQVRSVRLVLYQQSRYLDSMFRLVGDSMFITPTNHLREGVKHGSSCPTR